MSRRVLLVDNGSLEPASTLQLRRLAAELETRIGGRVEPVSLAHSEKIAAAELEGRPVELFEAALDRGIAEGVRECVVLPLFVGPSHAVTRHVPALIAERKKQFPELRVAMAEPLFVAGETRLAEILAAHIRELIVVVGERPRVAIVDHGSPNRAVTEVRDAVAAQVRAMLGDAVVEVAASSMERRPGAEFEFNEPLLANLLRRPEWRTGPVVVGMLFIAPGRHAGPDGDVAEICRAARGGGQGIRLTRLLGEHPLLGEILADRVRAVRG